MLRFPVFLLKVRLALPAYVEPPSLKITCVLAPCAGTNVAVSHVRLPEPFVLRNAPFDPPVMMTLLFGPKLLTPLTVNPVNVPNVVIDV